MPDSTQIIRNLEDAESFFLSMGCSHFHMDREFPEQSAQYRSLVAVTKRGSLAERCVVDWRISG